MTLEVVTFGCRLNAYESELIKKAAGDLDNTVILNSCAVTSEAERQLRQAIRKIKREDPSKTIIVTGCAAQINPEKYAKIDGVARVIGNEDKTNPMSYISSEKIIINDIMSVKETAHQMLDSLDGKTRAFMQVQNGCDHRCTYCIIPFGRGNNRSVPIGEIVNQASILVANGYKEIVITGVDITDYGLDLPGKPRLGQMVKRLLNNVKDIKRLRLSSIDVAEIDEDLLDLIENEERFMPHLHLSLQSGDNMILKRMKRRHTREQVIDFANHVRSIRKGITIGADIIAGFPTETDEMFENTFNLVKDANIIFCHVFPYSQREGTPAFRMPQVEKSIRKERAKKLRELSNQLLNKHLNSFVGSEIEVLVEQNGVARAKDFSQIKVSSKFEVGDIVNVVVSKVENATLISD